MNKEKRYNVEIYNYNTGITSAIIGKNMTERQADKREIVGLMRCNSDYGVRSILINN